MMKYLGFCGADDDTSIDAMMALSKECPIVEWGILFHPDKQSLPRYPSQAFVDRLCSQASHVPSCNLAAHLCGGHVVNLFKGDASFVNKLFLDGFNRIQVNATIENGVDLARIDGTCGKFNVQNLHDVITSTSYLDWIFQYNTQTSALACEFICKHSNVFVLHDGSCGTGTIIEDFPVVEGTYFLQGYAGGIGVDNVVEVIGILNNSMRSGQYWIDMESKLRNDSQDTFQIRICEQIVNLVKNIQK